METHDVTGVAPAAAAVVRGTTNGIVSKVKVRLGAGVEDGVARERLGVGGGPREERDALRVLVRGDGGACAREEHGRGAQREAQLAVGARGREHAAVLGGERGREARTHAGCSRSVVRGAAQRERGGLDEVRGLHHARARGEARRVGDVQGVLHAQQLGCVRAHLCVCGSGTCERQRCVGQLVCVGVWMQTRRSAC